MTGNGSIIRKVSVFALVVLAAIGAFFAWKVTRTAQDIHLENPTAKGNFENISSLLPGSDRETLMGEETGRINILLLGRAGESYPGKNLTDTVMLASVDTKSRRVGFLSLPRDLFIPIPGTSLSTKLNSLYQHGLSSGQDETLLLRAVGEITGEDIPYFVILDFDGFEKVIDDLGGIRIFSERNIRDTRYPGKNYSYETFELPAGWHTLDGKTALKYARERHSDPEGDFGRAKRQQQIIKAAQEKALSAGTVLNPFTVNRLLETLGESVRTNLSLAEIGSLIDLSKTVDLRNASTSVIDAWKKESLLRVSHIDVNGIQAFILVPRTGNWNEVRDRAGNIFDQEAIRKRSERVAGEASSLLILSRPEDAALGRTLSRTVAEAVPLDKVSVATSPLLEKNRKSAIMDRAALSKPFTLDELLKKFDLDRKPYDNGVMPKDLKDADRYDFVVILGENAATISDDTAVQSELGNGDDPFSGFFPAQEKK